MAVIKIILRRGLVRLGGTHCHDFTLAVRNCGVWTVVKLAQGGSVFAKGNGGFVNQMSVPESDKRRAAALSELAMPNCNPIANDTKDRELLLALLDAAVDAIIISDSIGTILRLNTAAAKLFGYDIDSLTGQNVSILMPPAMAARRDGFLKRHLESGMRRIIGIGRDVEGQRADGTVFPLHLSVGRADIAGEVTFVAILHDQTRERAAEEAAARSQRMDAIGQMTGGIAHDFNNLLTIVIGNLELLESHDITEESRTLISDALEAAEMGADLTSRLMVFSRKSTLQAELIGLNDVVMKSLAMLRRAIGAHVRVEASLAEDLHPVRLDATQLQTAILNLALNAQDAMPQGGRLFLETRNAVIDDSYVSQEAGIEVGDYVRLSVSDTGFGMTQQTRLHALEPFYTTKPVGRGTGLGLSTVYGFVKQSGGHLAIYSEIDKGTSISLYFPAASGTESHYGAEIETDHSQDQIGAGRLVLLVDDDARVLRLSKARMRALGFRCVTATSADAGWDILTRRHDIVLVFTDIVMPGEMSGEDLALRIATERPELPVLLTSGFSEGLLSGGPGGTEFPVLRKPYRQADLAAALQAVLARG